MNEVEELEKELEELKNERIEKEQIERLKVRVEEERARTKPEKPTSKTGGFLKSAGLSILKVLDEATKPKDGKPTKKKEMPKIF